MGSAIPYVDLPEDQYSKALVDVGLPEPVAGFLAGTHTATSKGDLYDERKQLSRLIGRPTRSIAASIVKALAD